MAEHGAPALLADDPGPAGPRRVVTHVLAVAAGQVSHPVGRFVKMESDDGLKHGGIYSDRAGPAGDCAAR